MPRPTRKAAKPTTTAIASPKAAEKIAKATEEEEELPVSTPNGKRQLRSQQTTPPTKSRAADSGIDDTGESPPSKRLALDVGASPGKSPKVTPRYGRRTSSGVVGSPRRLTFGGGRRTSGASDLVFDGLIDGFSPIKRNAPLETLDFDDEEELPQAGDVLAGTSAKPRAAESPDAEEEEEKEVAEESDSELFDIDTLVARTHKPKPGSAAARASLGDTSVVDLLGKGGAGELLPRRTRTRSQVPKPEPAVTKPARGRAATKACKTAASKNQSSSSSEEEEEDAGDSWKPSKPATTPACKPKKAAAAATARRAAPSRASAKAKPKDSEQTASAGAWPVDSKTAKYFDDIDGFELTEEAV